MKAICGCQCASRRLCHAELAKHLVLSADVRERETRSFVPQEDTMFATRCRREMPWIMSC